MTLRRRTENGHGVWQLKLPADDSRLELEDEGGPGQPPDELLALLTPICAAGRSSAWRSCERTGAADSSRATGRLRR